MFNQRRQHPGESIADYVAELRRLAATCNFKDFIDDALCDCLVCGLANESSHRRLLTDADGTTTFAKAVEMAQSLEQADMNARALNGQEVALKRLSANPLSQFSDHRPQMKPCFRCGKGNHNSINCSFADASCHYCKKKDI